MSEPAKNIDTYLDGKIRQTLQSNVSDDFTFELMKRIEIEKEFAKEDVKTFRMVKYITGGFVLALTAFIILLTLIINNNEESRDVGFFNTMLDKFSGIVESISVVTAEMLGFTFDYQTGLVVLLITGCVFLFYFADRIIFKKHV
ncbi:MAG: hypothetical protein ABI528_06625 [bacterium]